MPITLHLGSNRHVILIMGLSGSGKSQLVKSAARGLFHVNFDTLKGEVKRREKLAEGSRQELPIVGDITKLVSTTINRNPEYTFTLLYLREELDTVRARLASRNGRYNEAAILKRTKRLDSIARSKSAVIGTAEELVGVLHALLGRPIPYYEPMTLEYEPKVEAESDSSDSDSGDSEAPALSHAVRALPDGSAPEYAIYGPPKSGKTWVLNQLLEVGWNKGSAPTIVEVSRHATQLSGETQLVVIKADFDTLKDRNPTMDPLRLERKFKRAESVAKNHAAFAGSPEECLDWLLHRS